jgi:hypothetical protein
MLCSAFTAVNSGSMRCSKAINYFLSSTMKPAAGRLMLREDFYIRIWQKRARWFWILIKPPIHLALLPRMPPARCRRSKTDYLFELRRARRSTRMRAIKNYRSFTESKPSREAPTLCTRRSRNNLPRLFLRSENAGRRFWEFFANIRNVNTRRHAFPRSLMAFSTAWSTMLIGLRCAGIRCEKIAGSQTNSCRVSEKRRWRLSKGGLCETGSAIRPTREFPASLFRPCGVADHFFGCHATRAAARTTLFGSRIRGY